jgi:hypothetical protein
MVRLIAVDLVGTKPLLYSTSDSIVAAVLAAFHTDPVVDVAAAEGTEEAWPMVGVVGPDSHTPAASVVEAVAKEEVDDT